MKDFDRLEHLLKRSKFYSEETSLPEDEAYYEQLHDKIMAAVENTEIEKNHFLRHKKDLLKRHWRFYALMTIMFSVTVMSFNMARHFSFALFQNNHAIKSVQNEDQILSIISTSPELLANSVLSYKSEQDFLAESAVFQDETLTKEVFDSL